ncbi:MAG: hypothetical protein ABIC40_00380, partial [bacterium]
MRVQKSPYFSMRVLTFSIFLTLLLAGCARDKSPVEPGIANFTPLSGSSVNDSGESERSVWGIWDVSMSDSGELEIVPLREAQYRVNVVTFLQPPHGKSSNLNITIVDDGGLFTTGRIVMDVMLTHPFPVYPEYAGFDVMGVFINNGNYTSRHNDKIKYPRPSYNALLLNADGYTRWMNPSEFPASGMGGFTEGVFGTKKVNWTATINPYKYFCDGLGLNESIESNFTNPTSVADRGVFRAGKKNTRRYDLKFTISGGLPVIKFQYAVVVSWTESNPYPPNNVPGDFPENANMDEPFYVLPDTEGSTCFYNSSIDKGGNLLLNLEIFAHKALNEPTGVEGLISEIVIESPNDFIPGTDHMLSFNNTIWTVSPGSSSISDKFTLDCGAVDPQGPDPGDNPLLIVVKSKSGSYNGGTGAPCPAGTVTYYQTYGVSTVEIIPNAPGVVTGFAASDGDGTLGNHEVELTWDDNPDADEYYIERQDYNTTLSEWYWKAIHTSPSGQTLYVDTGARYCGTKNPITYRIKASNSYGMSPSWATDTGYPKTRHVGLAFWCAADNSSGLNAVVAWSRATADFNDCNSFWIPYGFEFVMENSGTFFWMTNTAYRNLTGSEPFAMHDAFGKIYHPNSINVYYVNSSGGSTSVAYSVAICPGSQHTTKNTFIVLCRDTRTACAGGYEIPIILAHECGHALCRYWDIYLMDLNGDGIMNDGATCSINTWCNGQSPYLPGEVPVMFCDVEAAYPEEPGSGGKVPKNLMWYSYCGSPVSEYDIIVSQYIEASS